MAPQMTEAIIELVLPIKFFVKSDGGMRNFSNRRDARLGFVYVYGRFMSLPPFLRAQPDDVWLSIKLQPRASANEIGKAMGNELRVKVTAPAVDSAANEALIRLLAETLGCARNRVELVRGQTSRHKVVRLHGTTAEAVLRKLSGRV